MKSTLGEGRRYPRNSGTPTKKKEVARIKNIGQQNLVGLLILRYILKDMITKLEGVKAQ